MRPLELTLRNFRSFFGEETVFDFRDRGLVGIVGPIGSGKTSILDAISFALYGKTPRIKARTKSLIHQRADGCVVSLQFEVDGDTWRVVRALRSKGQSEHALYRLGADEPDAERLDTVLLEGEVNARIVELLGLEFDAFGRSVMLAQGQFARFLEARQGERDKVLKGVFGHDVVDRMREIAKKRRDELGSVVAGLQARVDALHPLTARIAENRRVRAGLEDRVERLRKAEPALLDLDRRISDSARQIEMADRKLADLQAAIASFPDPEVVDHVAGAATAALAEYNDRVAAADAAREAATAATSALVGADESGEPELIRRCRDLLTRTGSQRTMLERDRTASLAAAEAHGDAIERRAQAGRRLDVAETAASEALAAADEAAAHLDVAENLLHAARHADMAATLRAGLARGEACPVCEQQVTTVPPPGEAGDVTTAVPAVAAARRHRDAAQAHSAAAGAELQAADESLKMLDKEVAERANAAAASEKAVRSAEAALSALLAELDGLLGPGDHEAVLEQRSVAYDSLRSIAAKASRSIDAARSAVDAAAGALKDAEAEMGTLRMTVVGVAARLGIDGVDLGRGDPAALRMAIGVLGEQARLAAGDLDVARTRHQRDRDAADAERRSLLADLDVRDGLDAELAGARARIEMVGAQIDADEKALAAGEDDARTLAKSQTQAALLSRLAADLTDTNFIRFLLEEEQARLADLGSDHLERLTGSRYRFTDSFGVLDLTTADSERSPDSLSGGETFLASLALALALAEMVSGGGGRLDAFFLDEGFGSLDPEHLDLAMDGIEALVAGEQDRLVAVVSHVPELRMRIDDRIELDRDPLTGDTIVVSGADRSRQAAP